MCFNGVCFKGVSWKFSECFEKVWRVFHGGLYAILLPIGYWCNQLINVGREGWRVFQWSFKWISWVFERNSKGVWGKENFKKKFHVCFKNVSMKFCFVIFFACHSSQLPEQKEGLFPIQQLWLCCWWQMLPRRCFCPVWFNKVFSGIFCALQILIYTKLFLALPTRYHYL